MEAVFYMLDGSWWYCFAALCGDFSVVFEGGFSGGVVARFRGGS